MQQASLILDSDFTVGEVDPRLFSGFIEHLGRHIYTGIYEPGHPTADANGFRQDVIEMVRELRMPLYRYPGGNFVSGYRWEDGVGPKEQRPAKLDLAWSALEPNTFGTNEFMQWCEQVNGAPIMAVNLGTRGIAEAQSLVEYCNHPGGSYYSDLRKSHGYAKPYGVKLWCLGNEMDGPWQTGQKTATDYGRLAREAAKAMKITDPSIETVLCGSSSRNMPTFARWEWEALHESYEQVDYLALHVYYGNLKNDIAGYLAQPDNMSDFITESAALADAVGASLKSKRKVHLSVDEWNVWDQSWELTDAGERWTVGRPQLEQIYNAEDALVVGGMLVTLLNNADRVKIGCLAQVVNAIGPIMTEPNGRSWRQSTFYPFAQVSQRSAGATVLQSVVKAPTYDSATRDKASIVHLASIRNKDSVVIFALNREPGGGTVELSGLLRGFDEFHTVRHTVLSHPDLKAANSADAPDVVVPRASDVPATLSCGSKFTAVLPGYSWSVIELRH